MPATHASRWLQLTMETVLDLWHGRLAAAEARLFTVAAPIVARAHAERARVADTFINRGGRGRPGGKAEAARLFTGAGATADRLGMRALAMEASELLTEC